MVVAVSEVAAVAAIDSTEPASRTGSTLRRSLSIATGALLAVGNASGSLLPDFQGWEASAALLYYGEADRVSALEPIISVRKSLDTDEYLSLKLTVDTLTGASATGAVSSDLPQTFTRPSGRGSYTVSGDQTPLDDTFHDTRVTVNGNWERPLNKDLTLDLGTAVSKEYDYFSFGLSAGLARDINEGNTTFSTGLSFSLDTSSPVGGEPIPFAPMQPAGTAQQRQGSEDDKQVLDAIIGVTQIIDRRSLFQLNYSLSNSDGYLNDPYKYISVVDPVTGNPLFENLDEPDLPVIAYENRPDSRTKHSLYALYKIAFDKTVLDASYRYLTDDWGIDSHTLDVHLRVPAGSRSYWKPHLRLYQQSAADFYTPFYVGDDRPAAGDSSSYGSADYRLGEFTGVTLGLEYGRESLSSGWSIAAEYYQQSGAEPAGKFGSLDQQTLFPDVDAYFVRFIRNF